MDSVNRPVRVDPGDIQATFIFYAARHFVAGNLFADVFGDLAPSFERDSRKTAFAVNAGRFDLNAVGEIGREVGLL